MAPNLMTFIFVMLAAVIGFSLCAAPPNIAKFSKECLEATNAYRAKHQAPPLKLNRSISAVSQEWADHILSTGNFEHRPNNIYGENIYATFSSDPGYKATCAMAVDSWYSEVSNYNYGDGFSMDTGHFTQLVWKNSKQLGVGFASLNGKNYVVCNYSPPGNYDGEFSDNVLPPRR